VKPLYENRTINYETSLGLIMKTVVITQPTFLPWMGYFEQLAQADLVVWLDSVQFARRSWQCRNTLKGTNAIPFWLTIPLKKQPRDTLLRDIRICQETPIWRTKHLQSIRGALGKAPYFDSVNAWLEPIYCANHEKLIDFNLEIINSVCNHMNIRFESVLSTELGVKSSKGNLILDLCKQVDATRYYSALGSREYLLPLNNEFFENGIELEFQKWEHPVYRQTGNTFVSHLSVIDALMNLGVGEVKAFLTPATGKMHADD